MRFFTRAWSDGELPDAESDAAVAAYVAHFESIRNELPDALLALHELSLHDGLVRSVVIDATNQTVEIRVCCGDLQVDYKDVVLRYAEVETLVEEPLLEEILNADDSVLHYDEIDLISERLFEHRLLFWPRGEMAIRFRRFELSVIATDARSYVRTRLVEIVRR